MDRTLRLRRSVMHKTDSCPIPELRDLGEKPCPFTTVAIDRSERKLEKNVQME